MPDALVKLKGILNVIPDEELKDYSLWIDVRDEVEAILVEDNAISLIKDSSNIRIEDDE